MPTVAVVGSALMSIDMSAAELTNVQVIVWPPPPRAAAANVSVLPAVAEATATFF